jgi:ketosteroid isomerase-like protein
VGDGEELIRDVWRRWNSGVREFDPEILDPEIEIHSALTGQVFNGEAGVRGWIAEIDEQFEAWEISIEGIDERSSTRFIVRGTVRARGRQSGVDLDQAVTWDVVVRAGRILRLTNTLSADAPAEVPE